jgi:hypothetical protein
MSISNPMRLVVLLNGADQADEETKKDEADGVFNS